MICSLHLLTKQKKVYDFIQKRKNLNIVYEIIQMYNNIVGNKR